MPLPAYGRDQNAPLAALLKQLPELLLGGVDRKQLTIAQHVHAKQGAFQPHGFEQTQIGRSRTQDPADLRVLFLKPGRYIVQHQGLGFAPALLDLLDEATFLGYRQLAEVAGAHPALAERLLVYIPDLCLTQAHQLAAHQQRDQLARRPGIDRIDARMNLHTRWNTQYQLAGRNTAADVARRAVPPGKQQQVYTPVDQFGRQPAGVLGLGPSVGQLADHLMLQAHFRHQIRAHGAGSNKQFDTLGIGQNPLQGLAHPLVGQRLNAHRQSLVGDVIRTLEGSLAAQPRQGIDDQANTKAL